MKGFILMGNAINIKDMEGKMGGVVRIILEVISRDYGLVVAKTLSEKNMEFQIINSGKEVVVELPKNNLNEIIGILEDEKILENDELCYALLPNNDIASL